eukprot:3489085-Pleurochrysis_carterae.AAC.1
MTSHSIAAASQAPCVAWARGPLARRGAAEQRRDATTRQQSISHVRCARTSPTVCCLAALACGISALPAVLHTRPSYTACVRAASSARLTHCLVGAQILFTRRQIQQSYLFARRFGLPYSLLT